LTWLARSALVKLITASSSSLSLTKAKGTRRLRAGPEKWLKKQVVLSTC